MSAKTFREATRDGSTEILRTFGLRPAGGLFKPVTLSSALAKVTGISGKAPRTAVFKALWAYIKKKVACGFPPRSPVHVALRVV